MKDDSVFTTAKRFPSKKATLRNKKSWQSLQESPKGNITGTASHAPKINEEHKTQVSEEIEGRA